jgi:hypothetical protein
MSNEIRFLLSLSILLPFAAALAKFKKIPPPYYPVVVLICLGLLNELIVYFFFRSHNAVPNNIFYFIEFFLYCLQFRNWKNILTQKNTFTLLTGGAFSFWVVDELLLLKINTYDSALLIFFPFILVLLAIKQLSFIVATGKTSFPKSAIFVFCISIIVFYSYRVLSEIFYHYARSSVMRTKIFAIQVYMNVIFNILTAIAIRLIPKKRDLNTGSA